MGSVSCSTKQLHILVITKKTNNADFPSLSWPSPLYVADREGIDHICVSNNVPDHSSKSALQCARLHRTRRDFSLRARVKIPSASARWAMDGFKLVRRAHTLMRGCVSATGLGTFLVVKMILTVKLILNMAFKSKHKAFKHLTDLIPDVLNWQSYHRL